MHHYTCGINNDMEKLRVSSCSPPPSANISDKAKVVGVSAAVALLATLTALALGIALCTLSIIRIKKGRGNAVKEDPYYASIHDLVEITNIGWIGVNMNRNQAYGTHAALDLEASAVAAGTDVDKHAERGDYDTDMDGVGRDADVAAHIEEECPMVDRDLDEDGYVDVEL